MLPNPLHPAVVHFPLVLAFLLPIFAIGAIWAIGRGARPRRAWSIPLAVALSLAASAWAAVETGEEHRGAPERGRRRVTQVAGEQEPIVTTHEREIG